MTAMQTIDHVQVAYVGGLPLHYPLQSHDMTDILDVESVDCAEMIDELTVANVMYIGSGGGGHPALPINLKRCIDYFFWIAFAKFKNEIEVDETKMTPSEIYFLEWWEQKYKDVVSIEPPIDVSWWTPSEITEVYRYYLRQEAEQSFIQDIDPNRRSTCKPMLIDQIIMNVVYATFHEVPLDYLVRHKVIDHATKDMINNFKKGMCIFLWEIYSWCNLGVTQDLYGQLSGRLTSGSETRNFTISDLRNAHVLFDNVGSQLHKVNFI